MLNSLFRWFSMHGIWNVDYTASSVLAAVNLDCVAVTALQCTQLEREIRARTARSKSVPLGEEKSRRDIRSIAVQNVPTHLFRKSCEPLYFYFCGTITSILLTIHISTRIEYEVMSLALSHLLFWPWLPSASFHSPVERFVGVRDDWFFSFVQL